MTACGASNESSGSGGLSGVLNGAGSTAQEAAMAAWKAGFQTANSDVTVNYDAVGSGGGRDEFLSGAVNFAGSDAYLSDDEIAKATTLCGSDPVEIPVYVSPIAVIYNLSGVDALNLSPATLAQIFAGTITTWNDPAITGENPGASLPDTTITPVHRSDDSGTTENFTDYLSQAAPNDWSYPAGQTWPLQSGEAGDGTSGVVADVTGGAGTIGYADASQAADLGQALIQVGSAHVGPSADAASKVLDESQVVTGRPASDIAIKVNRTTTSAGVYPIILISYQITCQTQKSQDAADLIKGFESYVVSEEGQNAAASAAGSAPLTAALRDKAQKAIDTITAK
jgi:phosphate transport system substrate-binding protein